MLWKTMMKRMEKVLNLDATAFDAAQKSFKDDFKRFALECFATDEKVCEYAAEAAQDALKLWERASSDEYLDDNGCAEVSLRGISRDFIAALRGVSINDYTLCNVVTTHDLNYACVTLKAIWDAFLSIARQFDLLCDEVAGRNDCRILAIRLWDRYELCDQCGNRSFASKFIHPDFYDAPWEIKRSLKIW